MKKILILLIAFAVISAKAQTTSRPIGTNIDEVTYYSTQLMFKNCFLQSSYWFTTDTTMLFSTWNTATNIPMRPDGYPTHVPYLDSSSQWSLVHTLILRNIGGYYPSGNYYIFWEGTGRVSLEFDSGNHTFTLSGGSFAVSAPSQNGIHVIIRNSQLSDPVHNIRIVHQNDLPTYLTQPFNDTLMSFLSDFSCLRFMWPMEPMSAALVNWNDRTRADNFTQANTSRGIAYEYIIQMANLLQKDVWICVPHRANDAFIDSLANLFENTLNPSLKVYVEYGNELWNSIYSQQENYIQQQGNTLGYPGPLWEKGWLFGAKRAVDCHRIFENHFGINSPRVVKVLAGFTTIPWLSGFLLNAYNNTAYNPSGVTVNAFAIAPYFGGWVADAIGNAGQIDSITVPQIVDSLYKSIRYTETSPDMNGQVAATSAFGIPLICYEGGQHLVSNLYQNDTTLTNKLIATNADPLMEQVMCEYLDSVYTINPGNLFVYYSSINYPSQYGSWGMKASLYHTDTQSPKYRAIKNCVLSYGIPTNIPETTTNTNIVVFPNPATDYIQLQSTEQIKSIEIMNAMGQKVYTNVTKSNQIDCSKFTNGIYFIAIETEKSKLIKKFIINK